MFKVGDMPLFFKEHVDYEWNGKDNWTYWYTLEQVIILEVKELTKEQLRTSAHNFPYCYRTNLSGDKFEAGVQFFKTPKHFFEVYKSLGYARAFKTLSTERDYNNE